MLACESREVWQRIDAAPGLWLFLDYDGTLADFAPTPDHIQPDAALIDLIAQLVRLPDLRVSIISGRRLAHIRQLLPIDDLLIAGTYGVELHSWQGESIDRVTDLAIRPSLDRVKGAWQTLLAGKEGFYLEDKGWAIALHAKDADPTTAQFVLPEARRHAQSEAQSQPESVFRVLGGDRFLEIGPTLAHKGRTIEFLFASFPHPGALPIYIGDDDKDEEAFGVIQEHGGLAMVVSTTSRSTIADCRLESPAATRGWLRQLLLRRPGTG